MSCAAGVDVVDVDGYGERDVATVWTGDADCDGGREGGDEGNVRVREGEEEGEEIMVVLGLFSNSSFSCSNCSDFCICSSTTSSKLMSDGAPAITLDCIDLGARVCERVGEALGEDVLSWGTESGD